MSYASAVAPPALEPPAPTHKALVIKKPSPETLNNNIMSVLNKEELPQTLSLARDHNTYENKTPGQSVLEIVMGALADPGTEETVKKTIREGIRIGLFLATTEGVEYGEDFLKEEIKAVHCALFDSPAREMVTHLDIGYRSILAEMENDSAEVEHDDKPGTGEELLQKQTSVVMADPQLLGPNNKNRAFLLRMVRWVSLSFRNVETLTLHQDSKALHQAPDYQDWDEYVQVFPKLREFNVLSKDPEVAIYYRVKNGKLGISKEDMTTRAHKLQLPSYYATKDSDSKGSKDSKDSKGPK